MEAIPLELKDANLFVEKYHRHHAPVHRDKFRVGCIENGVIHGVVQCGRPVSRCLDDGKTIEVVRLCTDGFPNACSFLYSRAARIAKEMGYEKIITYILCSENGSSLKATGWTLEADNVGGTDWNCKSRPRQITADGDQMSLFSEKKKYPQEKKQRWAKYLVK